MVRTELTREDALILLQMGKDLFDESHFRNENFQPNKVWVLLNATLKYPTRYFICYDKTDGGEIGGYIFAYANENYFSDHLVAQDYAMYVKPEYRGSSIFIRLLKTFEKWADNIGAQEIRIGHSTGIDSEKTQALFKKLGFKQTATIFSKEIQ